MPQTPSTFQVWNGNHLKWPPPEDWLQGADGRWWPPNVPRQPDGTPAVPDVFKSYDGNDYAWPPPEGWHMNAHDAIWSPPSQSVREAVPANSAPSDMLQTSSLAPPSVPPPPEALDPSTSESRTGRSTGGIAQAFIIAGIVVVGVIGLVALNQSESGSPSASGSSTSTEFSLAAGEFRSNAAGAVGMCCANTLSVTLGQNDEEISNRVMTAFGVLLSDLGFNEAIIARINNTRALDGTQTAVAEHASAFWTYHPDDGLNIVFERTE